MLQMHKLSYYSVISFFLFCRDCPNAPISPEAMEIGATLRRDHGTPLVKSWGEQLASDGEKKLHSSTPSPLSRGYTYLNKWKLIHDYLGKAAWIVGSFRIYQKLMISGEDWQNEDILPVNVNFSLLTKTHCSCSKVLAANFLQQPG